MVDMFFIEKEQRSQNKQKNSLVFYKITKLYLLQNCERSVIMCLCSVACWSNFWRPFRTPATARYNIILKGEFQ